MAEFAGLIRLDGESAGEAASGRLPRSIHSPRAASIWRPDPFCIFTEGREGMDAAATQPRPDRTLLVDAWLDSPAEAAAALGLERVPENRALCAAAVAKWGIEEAAKRLTGDFVFAEWDSEARRLIIARDAFGARPIYYCVTPQALVFATTLQTMLSMPEVPRDLDEVSLAHSLTLAVQDREQTMYRHIRRVPPGGAIVFEKGQLRTSRWFTADAIAPVRRRRDEEYVEEARALLDEAVRRRLPEHGPWSSQLSGGFDSAGVTATAARLLGDKPLIAFTRVGSVPPPAGQLDEQYFAGLLAQRYPNIEWVVIDRVFEAVRDTQPEQEAAMTMMPRRSGLNASWFEAMIIDAEARGVEGMLNGSGGNLTLSYHGRPDVPGALARGRFAEAMQDIRGVARQRGISPARSAASQLFYGLMPRSVLRWRARRQNGATAWSHYSLVSPDFLASLDYDALARERGHDVPFHMPVSDVERRITMLQGQVGRDFFPYARRRRRMAYHDPYMDRRLVEFCLGLPNDQYWRNGQGRWLARRVLADRVPAETLAQVRLGVQSSDWYSVASSRREVMEAAVERIARSPLASRVLDVRRMVQLLDDWPSDAESAEKSVNLHNYGLQRAIAMGGYLRWFEGRND